MEEYPDNSFKAKRQQQAPSIETDKADKIEPVVQGRVMRKKRSIGGRIAEVFTGEDARSVVRNMWTEQLLPGVRDIAFNAAQEFMFRAFFGDSRPSSNYRSSFRSGGGFTPGRTNYQQYSPTSSRRDPSTRPPAGRRSGRGPQGYKDIVLGTRAEAEGVLNAMEGRIHRNRSVSIGELYQLLGIPESEYDWTDSVWGWWSARGFDVEIDRDGYRLVFPHPESLED